MTDPAATFQEALALHARGELQAAEALCREILGSEPRDAGALHLLGITAFQSGRPLEAVELIGRAIAIDPDNPASHLNLGTALHCLQRTEEALTSIDRALARQPDSAEAFARRGNILQEIGRHEDALASFDRSLAIQPGQVEVLNDRGVVLRHLHRFEEALHTIDRALALSPDSPAVLNNRGSVLLDLERAPEALASYQRALAVSPDDRDALGNLANVLQRVRRFPEARQCYERLLAINPQGDFLFGNWLYTGMLICEWNGLQEAFGELARRIDRGEKAAHPLITAATPLSLRQQRKCAELAAAETGAAAEGSWVRATENAGGRIRLGYFSADFCSHPVTHLMAGLFEQHDRRKFQVFAFSFGPPVMDAMRARLETAFDQFIDVRRMTDREVALLARSESIDIAVDLMGFTLNARTGILAEGAAPVQVSYLGYPGTMGADFIHYLLADRTIIPLEHEPFYREKIACLPHSFQVNDRKREIASNCLGRTALGLPESGFVFCNFNNCFKLVPEDFDIWMRLLREVPGSVLWLAGTNRMAKGNLRKEASSRGVDPDRIVFKEYTESLSDHLAELRHADLFLDSRYFNAHTTGSDALWAGVPLLTRLGVTYASRVAASLLTAVGLPELITVSDQAYESLARRLATDPPALAALRQRLADNRLTHPLFDTALFTRHIESAYRAMWQRHQAGLPPESFVVDSRVDTDTGGAG